MASFTPSPNARRIVEGVAGSSPGGQRATRNGADRLERSSIDEFWRNSRGESGAARSPTTPPLYARSFVVSQTSNGGARLTNVDPGAVFVEFGALAGGATRVLGYAPMRRAVDRNTI